MEYILKKSRNKGKRFVIEMPNLSHKHNFGAFPFEKGTYIDHGDDKIKKAWIARHKNDKNWNNKHSGIYYSRHLLWGANKSLIDNVKALEKKDKVKIIIKL
jgi:hypothetical protein